MPAPSKQKPPAEGRNAADPDLGAVPRRDVFRGLAALGLGLAATPALAREPAAPAIAREEFRVPTGEDGIELYVRNKHPAGQARFAADRILLYVHGATYPASTAFDLPLAGLSMMDYLAGLGFDVYLVDLPGYGFSSRPKQMDRPAADNPPFMRTADAAKAVGVAVDYILKRRGVEKLDLMGWSWGTSTMGLYTTTHNDRVNRLVLYAPQWIAKAPPNLGTSGPLGAYRTVTRDSARDRWLKGVAGDKRTDLIPAGWFEQWADATWATDAAGAGSSPPVLRAPNGVVADSQAYWQAGKPLYDPGEIRVPTLIIHAEWDADLPSYQAQEYFTQLTNAPYKRFVELGEGTHTVMMEKNRMQFFREVAAFLQEAEPQALN
ncbi:alpha/beta hydrolase [Methylobacterium sp. WL30]|uniref:alpha/beta hydrolase n=1 Tax=unclassified Methylobacterium TaxID=2615210 RepID=UPI0011CCA7BB|nr:MULTISPECIES: alpha/beta fold hydrolase [unclassified Methylobacterium]TXN28577.1 alpha/beta hydrolase [Methylobacterium sp. WL93]TXN51682.1 alpha/beta hydrolase [Methylobacterium sp. WL119]TXN68395.1 alpha/beta hydrolase [Methylobacterium sp. WL30]